MSPWAPPRPCTWPGCPLFQAPRRAFCTEHQRATWRHQNATRDPAIRAFYDSAAWRRLRDAKKAQAPLCEDCLGQGRSVPTEQIDHVVPVREDPSRALDLGNLKSLCMSCHSRRTLADRRRR